MFFFNVFGVTSLTLVPIERIVFFESFVETFRKIL